MKTNKYRIHIEDKTEVNTYAHIDQVAYLASLMLDRKESGSLYFGMIKLVFSAFTVEAFCNHIGSKLFEHWDYLERNTIKDKLSLVCTKLQIPINFGVDPWNTINQCIKFRDLIAHGKSSVETNDKKIHEVHDVESTDKIPYPESDWENMITDSLVKRSREQVHVAVVLMHKAAGLEGPVFSRGIRSRFAKILQR